MVGNIEFCIAYVIVDALCFVLTIVISSNISRDSGSERQVRALFLLLTFYMVFTLFDAIWALLAYGRIIEPSLAALAAVNCIALTAVAFTGNFWYFFSLAYFRSKLLDRKKMNFVFAIPALLVPVVSIIGNALHMDIVIDASGAITYGPLHIVVTSVSLLYLIAATAVAAQARVKATTSAQRHMSTVFILFMIAPAVAGVFTAFVPDTPVAVASIMISVVFVIMSMQESRISSDVLTGLNNRRRADAYLEESMGHASHEHPLYLFIIDMDYFKAINDTYGHLEGDHALQLMADALRNACAQSNAFAARWGGDEFVVICAHGMESEPEAMVVAIRNALASVVGDAHVAYQLNCTVGYALCESADESRAELIAAADRMLYQRKSSRHQSAKSA